MKTFMKLGVEVPMGQTILLGGRESVPSPGNLSAVDFYALQPQ